MATNSSVYALNLFDIVDREEYLTYSRRSAREVAPPMTPRMLTSSMAINLLEEVAVEEIRR